MYSGTLGTYGGQGKYGFQNNAVPNRNPYAKWSSGQTSPATTINMRAHIPQSQTGRGKAVVRYTFCRDGSGVDCPLSAVINQSNYSGWVFIGGIQNAKSSQMRVSNACVAGYACSNYEVEFDDAAYSYWINP
jgi:hypothetical protein